MDSNKNISRKSFLVSCVAALLLGIGLGAIINDIPFVTFDTKVDVATCIAILGLVATVFYIPSVVERKFVQVDNINEVIRSDIETIHEEVGRLKGIYLGIKPDVKVSNSKYMEILASFKTISASILALNDELEARNRLCNFKEDVYNNTFVIAKEACTDNLINSKKLDKAVIISATVELNKLQAKLREYRYKTYSQGN